MIIKKFFTILFSIIIALFLCEFIYSFLDKNTKKYNQILNIYSLWSDKNKTGGRKNIEGKIWTYDENNEFFTSLYIYKNNKWIKEFEYTHNSNNFGLNQINDISLKKKSIIFLGASTPEGWGANPWFNKLQKKYTNSEFQLINGSLHGTGVYSWKILNDYLKKNDVQIDKVIIFIHGDFWINVAKTIPEDHINCLKDYKLCNNPSYLQFGMPLSNDEKEIIKFLEKIKENRNKSIIKKTTYINSFKDFTFYLREIAPGTYQIYRYLRIKYNKKLYKQNLIKFIDEYKNNLLIVHIPQQIEYKNKKLTQDSIDLINFIKKNNGKIFNTFEECEHHVTNDYYPNEGHPNKLGYAKLEQCAVKALNQILMEK
jgi:hypothetical protein